jgi:hypothetical protein
MRVNDRMLVGVTDVEEDETAEAAAERRKTFIREHSEDICQAMDEVRDFAMELFLARGLDPFLMLPSLSLELMAGAVFMAALDPGPMVTELAMNWFRGLLDRVEVLHLEGAIERHDEEAIEAYYKAHPEDRDLT